MERAGRKHAENRGRVKKADGTYGWSFLAEGASFRMELPCGWSFLADGASLQMERRDETWG